MKSMVGVAADHHFSAARTLQTAARQADVPLRRSALAWSASFNPRRPAGPLSGSAGSLVVAGACNQ